MGALLNGTAGRPRLRKASGSFFVGFMRFRFVAAPGALSGNIYGFSEEGERDYGQDETHLSRDLRGGGAKSPLWRKIVANVMDMPVDIPQTEQGPAFGAAMLAMVGCGEYKSAKEAAAAIVRVKQTIQPDKAAAARYARRYAHFTKLYPVLKGLF